MQVYTLLFLIAVSTEAKKQRTDRNKPKNADKPPLYGKEFLNTRMGIPDEEVNRGLIPVPFGHIFKEGIEDPDSSFRYPFDALELSVKYLKDGPLARDLIQTHKKKFQVILHDNRPPIDGVPVQNLPKVYHDPTPRSNLKEPDPFEQQDAADDIPSPPSENQPPPNHDGQPWPNQDDQTSPDRDDKDSIFPDDQPIDPFREKESFSRTKKSGPRGNITIVPFHFEAILKRNIEEPPKYRLGGGRIPEKYAKLPAQSLPDYQSKLGRFAQNSYDIYEKPKVKLNRTTCNEFAKNAKFHPNDIVNIDWVPFYVWTQEEDGVVKVAYVHRFTYPTKKVVKQYRDRFGPFLNQSVDWDQPKLYFKSHTVQALLIAADRTGRFYGIPFYQIPTDPAYQSSVNVPVIELRIKIVDPYIAMMFCSLDYANIMAISGTEPQEYKKCVKEAEILKFQSPGVPIRRDVRAEATVKRAEMIAKARANEMKYISAADQMAASGLK